MSEDPNDPPQRNRHRRLDQTEILDGDMTAGDLITTLERLRFRHGLLTIRLDRDACDFLVASLVARHGK